MSVEPRNKATSATSEQFASFPALLMGLPCIQLENSRRFPEKGFQILAYLSLAPGYRASRRQIAELLWDSEDGAVAFGNLRQVLARMKRALNDSSALFGADNGYVWLSNQGPQTDLQAIDARGGEVLVKNYRGHLLEGVTELSDAFHDWLTIARSRLEGQYFDAAEIWLRDATRYGSARVDELEGFAARFLCVDPDREASYLALIKAFRRINQVEKAEKFALERELRFGVGSDRRRLVGGATMHRKASSALAPQPAGDAGTDASTVPRPEVPPRVCFLKPRLLEGGDYSKTLLNALVDDVANELSRFRTFVMLAPHSTFQLAGSQDGCTANEISADYQISGHLKPDHVLSLRLTRSRSGEIAWAGEFPVGDEALLKSFSTLCRLIAQELCRGIERELSKEFGKRANSGAYASYLIGQEAMRECLLPRLRHARKHFRKSASEAPVFGPAYARVAQTLYQEWLLVGARDPEKLNEAHTIARKSVDVDPNDGLSHWINGVIALYRREFDQSERHFEIAEVIAPNSADLLVQYGDALSHLAHPSQGMEKFLKALEINPMPPEHYWWVGASIAFNLEDFPRSIEYCNMIKDDESVVRLLAAAHALNGDRSTAQFYGKKVKELYPDLEVDELASISPDKDKSRIERYKEGLRLSGV